MSGKAAENFWIEQLLRRAGFGCTPQELAGYKALGYEDAVEQLINPQRVPNDELGTLIEQQDFDFTRLDDLKRWWLYRMCFTRRPLEEKMTLFWHGHFATANAKVGQPYLMYMQNLLMRKFALGNFHDLLLGISRDPAMIIWLDNQQNRKGKPNENYAREVMELFTVGIGHYTEQDVKESARAFTGWQTRPDGFYFNANQHDNGEKTFLGHTGDLNGDDIVAILVSQPATAQFLARKMVTFFVADKPDQSMIDDVADAYMASRFQIRPMLKTIFTHRLFRSDKAYHAKIKSPAELVVGTLKTLQVTKLDADLPAVMARMGQNLFEPPNVKGWDGGPAWISTNTMMERFNFATRITQQKFDALEGYFSPSQLAANQGLRRARDLVDYFLALLVDGDVPADTRDSLIKYVSTDFDGQSIEAIPDDRTLDAKLRGLVHLIMTLPTYQLA